MSFVAWVLFGLVAGFVGSKLVNSTGRRVLVDAGLGIAGAMMGGLLFDRIAAARWTELNLGSLFFAVCGAALLLFVYHAVSGERGRGSPRRDRRARFSSQSPSRWEALDR